MTQGVIATHNVGSKTHPDSSDAIDPLTGMTVAGRFDGGKVRFPQVRLRTEYQPGDVMLVWTRHALHAIETSRGEAPVTAPHSHIELNPLLDSQETATA